MKRLFLVICTMLCVVSLCACQKKPATPTAPEQNAAQTDQAKETFLHHAQWNMSREALREAVGSDKIENGSEETILNWMLTDELSYIFGERRVSVAYLFSKEDKLTSITVQAHCNEGETVEKAMAATRKAMDSYYGASEGEDKNAHWHTEDAVISIVELQGAKASFIIQYASAEGHNH